MTDQATPNTHATTPDTLRTGGGFIDPTFASQIGDALPSFATPDATWTQIKRNASRTVYYGHVGGETIYLKQFHSRSPIRDRLGRMGFGGAKREFTFSQFLAGHGITVPTVLAASWSACGQWIATRAVAPAQPLDEWHAEKALEAAAIPDVRRATLKLADLVGKMHAAGVVHGDLHCGNVLVRTDSDDLEMVLTDLHRASKCSHLSRRQKAMNLAQLFHDRYHLTGRTDRLRFLKRYLASSGATESLRGWQLLVESFSHRHTHSQHRQRDRRILGTNKYFQRYSGPSGWRGHLVMSSKRQMPGSRAATMNFSIEQWNALFGDDPMHLLEGPDATIVKDSRSSLVARRTIKMGDRSVDVFIKYARRKHWWKAFVDCFRPSRALRAFRLGHALLTRRIATALPLAAIERRVGPVFKENLLITEAMDSPRLDGFLMTWLAETPVRNDLDANQQRQLGTMVLYQMGRLLQQLHDNGFAHRDLKASNLFVHWDQSHRPQLVLIDLDGLRQVRRITTRQRFQGLMRLNVSLLQCPAVNYSGQLRMLLGYLRRPGSGRIHFKPYWRVLERWSARKLQQQLKDRQTRQRLHRQQLARSAQA
jgi:tRNA A-37 threonylcarbamoyl transferase component Bud32